MLRRLIWNPRWNESLFLVSCAERLADQPTAHSENEIFARIAADLARAPDAAALPAWLSFRLLFLSREARPSRARCCSSPSLGAAPARAMSLDAATRLTEILVALAFIQQSLEHLSGPRRNSSFSAPASSSCGLVILGLAQPWPLAALAALSLVILVRFQGPYNGGSDRMGLLALWCLALAHLADAAVAQIAGYLGLQLMLPTLIAGGVKIVNPDWRSGSGPARRLPGLRLSGQRDPAPLGRPPAGDADDVLGRHAVRAGLSADPRQPRDPDRRPSPSPPPSTWPTPASSASTASCGPGSPPTPPSSGSRRG